MENIVIIGNGIAGITAARHIRKQSDSEVTVISKESDYFFSRTALMYVYMGHMRFEDIQPYEPHFWVKNNISLIRNEVTGIDTSQKTIVLATGESLTYSKLIFATGSRPAFYNWPGQELNGVQGMYSKQDLEQLESLSPKIKTAVVVGGGLIGIELVEMLLSRGIHVHFVIRDKRFWGNILPENDSKMVMKHANKHHGITFHYETELKEILGNHGNVQQIKLSSGQEIACEFVGITTGVIPNKEFATKHGIETDRGILVNEFLETSVPAIYAIGDCAQHRNPMTGRTAVEQVWYTGRIMGETVAKTITGKPTAYNPGHWFNSAKFFDLEYQTYGLVPNKTSDNCAFFEWEHHSKDLRMTFAYDPKNETFLGVNTFGIRLRHELFDNWLTERKTLTFVIQHLASANFDPEFYKSYEKDIAASFTETFGKPLTLAPKTWWRHLLSKKV